jgi:hypothetical protein
MHNFRVLKSDDHYKYNDFQLVLNVDIRQYIEDCSVSCVNINIINL